MSGGDETRRFADAGGDGSAGVLVFHVGASRGISLELLGRLEHMTLLLTLLEFMCVLRASLRR